MKSNNEVLKNYLIDNKFLSMGSIFTFVRLSKGVDFWVYIHDSTLGFKLNYSTCSGNISSEIEIDSTKIDFKDDQEIHNTFEQIFKILVEDVLNAYRDDIVNKFELYKL